MEESIRSSVVLSGAGTGLGFGTEEENEWDTNEHRRNLAWFLDDLSISMCAPIKAFLTW